MIFVRESPYSFWRFSLMPKKYLNKAAKPLCIPREVRYLRAIVLGIIEYLTLFMNKTLAVRLVSILFIASEKTNKEISIIVGCSLPTIRTLRRRMNTEEVSELMLIAKGSGRPPKASALTADKIAEKVLAGAYSCLRQIADMIEKCFSLKLSQVAITKILKLRNIRKLKSASLPAKADPTLQRSFYEDELFPLMKKSQQNECTLHFMDAAHFVMGCDFRGFFYGLGRRFVRTFSGRMRYNVLGSMEYGSKKVYTVTNDTYITSKQVCRLLVKIVKAYRGQNIYVVLDNTRYQRCAIVQKVAEKLKIKLVFLPPYSPNLNLIERFWKFVKGELRSKFYDNFSEFCGSIDSIIASSCGENKARVNTLIGEKVQLFDDLTKVSENFFEQSHLSQAHQENDSRAA